jgi:hypothetical protein
MDSPRLLALAPVVFTLAGCFGAPAIEPRAGDQPVSGRGTAPPAGPRADPLDGRKDVAPAPGTDGWVGDKFKFAVWGDSRPDNNTDLFEKDYNDCVTPILDAIFKDALKRDAMFMVGTGDYINAYMPDPGKTGIYDDDDKWTAGVRRQYGWINKSADIFRKAMPKARPVYFALGNHEALGWPDANSLTYDEKPNIKYYLTDMIPGLKPWFSVTMKSGARKDVTSKFIFIAPNTWNADQEKFLKTAIDVKTNYTFIIRHEGNDDHGCIAPGMAVQNEIIKGKHTLLLEGHTHHYSRAKGSNEVIAGNGGAPFVAGFKDKGFHGYLTIEQTEDSGTGKLLVQVWNVAKPEMPFETFKVLPDGKVSDESIDSMREGPPPGMCTHRKDGKW